TILLINKKKNMLDIQTINKGSDFKNNLNRNDFVNFLYTHLEPFGDEKKAIDKCIDYAFSTEAGKGGFLLAAYNNDELAGALIMNDTGMEGYIPEHILVYIAVNSKFRNQGIGKQIVDAALEIAQGDIALHVEYNNPAKRLYERLGFESKYAEMRLKRDH
ncbi:MAG: GNAT family N-acetyltransferase, partial [Ignavibacteriaceae bacterium]|nr:GNAT family N-acetyltransferase [Ignavibacteriaceae bacterium]